MLDAQDLAKAHGYRPVLKGVSLSVAAGEFVALLGPNGSGKTTLLRILATLQRPERGSLRIAGVDALADQAGARRHIGVVLHQTLHYADLSARENLRVFADLHGLAQRDAAVTRALEQARLTARAGDRVKTFSRGMLQRLSVARALLHQPGLLLLDEPFTGLDAESGARLAGQLEAFAAQGGAVLMSTHETARGMSGVTRILRLAAGRLEEQP